MFGLSVVYRFAHNLCKWAYQDFEFRCRTLYERHLSQSYSTLIDTIRYVYYDVIFTFVGHVSVHGLCAHPVWTQIDSILIIQYGRYYCCISYQHLTFGFWKLFLAVSCDVFSHILQGHSLSLGQSYDCPSACERTLRDMGKFSGTKLNQHVAWKEYRITGGDVATPACWPQSMLFVSGRKSPPAARCWRPGRETGIVRAFSLNFDNYLFDMIASILLMIKFIDDTPIHILCMLRVEIIL